METSRPRLRRKREGRLPEEPPSSGCAGRLLFRADRNEGDAQVIELGKSRARPGELHGGDVSGVRAQRLAVRVRVRDDFPERGAVLVECFEEPGGTPFAPASEAGDPNVDAHLCGAAGELGHDAPTFVFAEIGRYVLGADGEDIVTRRETEPLARRTVVVRIDVRITAQCARGCPAEGDTLQRVRRVDDGSGAEAPPDAIEIEVDGPAGGQEPPDATEAAGRAAGPEMERERLGRYEQTLDVAEQPRQRPPPPCRRRGGEPPTRYERCRDVRQHANALVGMNRLSTWRNSPANVPRHPADGAEANPPHDTNGSGTFGNTRMIGSPSAGTGSSTLISWITSCTGSETVAHTPTVTFVANVAGGGGLNRENPSNCGWAHGTQRRA